MTAIDGIPNNGGRLATGSGAQGQDRDCCPAWPQTPAAWRAVAEVYGSYVHGVGSQLARWRATSDCTILGEPAPGPAGIPGEAGNGD